MMNAEETYGGTGFDQNFLSLYSENLQWLRQIKQVLQVVARGLSRFVLKPQETDEETF